MKPRDVYIIIIILQAASLVYASMRITHHKASNSEIMSLHELAKNKPGYEQCYNYRGGSKTVGHYCIWFKSQGLVE